MRKGVSFPFQMVSALKQRNHVWVQNLLSGSGSPKDIRRCLQDSLEPWHCPNAFSGLCEPIAFYTDSSLAPDPRASGILASLVLSLAWIAPIASLWDLLSPILLLQKTADGVAGKWLHILFCCLCGGHVMLPFLFLG